MNFLSPRKVNFTAFKVFAFKAYNELPQALIDETKNLIRPLFTTQPHLYIGDNNELDKILEFAVRYDCSKYDKTQHSGEALRPDWVVKHSLEECRFEKPKGLLIYGQTGTGKTTTARILSSLLDIEIIDVEEVARKYMTSKGNDWLDDYIDAHEHKPLIIDDIGSESEMKKFGNSSPIVSILTARARSWEWRGVPTVYTTNIPNIETLASEDRYGSRIASRIQGCCECVFLDGRDCRLDNENKKA
jgi:hypothetical protein